MRNYVKNRAALLAHGAAGLRGTALDIATHVLETADPGEAVRKILAVQGERLFVHQREFNLDGGARVFVIGAGKATYPIAKALDTILGARIHRGFVTCKLGQTGTLANIELHLANHPIPGDPSYEAASRTRELLQQVRSGDIVLACFTGGSSALFVEPVSSIRLADKAQANRILLGSGANIVEINAVRKHISAVKGGKLVRSLPRGAHLVNLTVSDVIGDRLDCITDPSVPDRSTFDDARATLDKYALWDEMPESVSRFLRNGTNSDETCREQDIAHIDRTDCLLLTAAVACDAAAEAARLHGFTPMILSTSFEGDSRELGRFMAAIARQICRDDRPANRPCALIGGGETTVQVANGSGSGGPNQEFALSFAAELTEHDNVVALGLDTDGTDGPTEIAGGLVDATTARRARDANIDLHQSLARHDVSSALRRLSDAIITGATGTNVNDLKLVLIE